MAWVTHLVPSPRRSNTSEIAKRKIEEMRCETCVERETTINRRVARFKSSGETFSAEKLRRKRRYRGDRRKRFLPWRQANR